MGWFRRSDPEVRASNGGGDFFDAVVAQLEAQASTRAADAGATAAIEAAAGALSRAFADASVEAADWAIEAVTPGFLAQIGRDLVRGGASLHRIDTPGGRVRLWPVAQWFWHEGRSSDPNTWTVRVTEYGPSGSMTHVLPWSAVVWQTWGVSTTTPWVGRGPASWAPLTAKLMAETERSLGDESSGPVAQILPVPQDGGDGSADDPLKALKADIGAARGRAVLTESTSGAWGEGRAAAPQRDWVPSRLGPDYPSTVPEAARDAFGRMLAACGTTISLFDSSATAPPSAKPSDAGTWEQCSPLARLLEHELTLTKLETPGEAQVRQATRLDLQARASGCVQGARRRRRRSLRGASHVGGCSRPMNDLCSHRLRRGDDRSAQHRESDR